MFKNRKLEVKLVKNSDATTETSPHYDPDFIPAMAKELVKILVIGTLIIVCAGTAANIISEIVIDKYTNN